MKGNAGFGLLRDGGEYGEQVVGFLITSSALASPDS
jgi:hypothetical protein